MGSENVSSNESEVAQFPEAFSALMNGSRGPDPLNPFPIPPPNVSSNAAPNVTRKRRPRRDR